MKTKKKENVIIIVILVVMVIAIIGVSYAAFSFSRQGNTPNKITTGSITMTYTESSNTISLSNALPTTDKTGTTRLKEGEYFDFTVSSEITGEVNINYEISAKEVGEGTIDGSNIKLYLTRLTEDGTEEQLMTPKVYNEETSENTYTGRPANEMSLYTGSMNASESNDYRLRMYVTEEYNPQGDGGGLTFAVKVNVYGKAGDKMPANGPVSDVILDNLGDNGNTYDDGDDTFITGTDPNNYIWYSGKLWRAVSVNNEAKTTKLVTNNATAIPYSSGSGIYEASFVRKWLNDTSVDGFLYNLRDPEKFIVVDAVWDATMNSSDLGNIEKPNGKSIVTDAVGLLNTYEYQSVCNTTTFSSCYLSSASLSYTLTPYNDTSINYVSSSGINALNPTEQAYSVDPSVNLKNDIKIVGGNGTENSPYRLAGDNDNNLSGALLNERYSGEYIKFGKGDNNLYRIVSHENGIGTKIVSNDSITALVFNYNRTAAFSTTSTIGSFLNNDYLNPENGYLTSEQVSMIEDNTTWYLGGVGDGEDYKLAKYANGTDNVYTTDVTTAKVGLARVGELVSFNYYGSWTLTPYYTISNNIVQLSYGTQLYGYTVYTSAYGVMPVLNLKQNVVITGGDGTKNNPFTLELAS